MREQLRELFFVLFEQTRGFADDATARRRRCRTPTAKRARRRFNRGTRFLARRLTDRAEHVVRVRGVDVLRGSSGGGFSPFAADKIAISSHRSACEYITSVLFRVHL